MCLALIYFIYWNKITRSLCGFNTVLINNLSSFPTGATARLYRKAKESEIEDAIAEVLRLAPHRPGGSKYKVFY